MSGPSFNVPNSKVIPFNHHEIQLMLIMYAGSANTHVMCCSANSAVCCSVNDVCCSAKATFTGTTINRADSALIN
jgi:hypothetical protein